MSERVSWYRCEACGEPATAERGLIRVAVKGNPRASWAIHAECQAKLQAALVDGVELMVTP